MKCALISLSLLLGVSTVFAQAPARPAYQALRFDEDWSFLKDITANN